MNEDKLIDQTELAKSVAEKIHYEFKDAILVKPLDPIKVTKEFTKPVNVEKEAKKDDNDVEAVDYEVETETKEVESEYKKGVVLKVGTIYQNRMNDEKYFEYPVSVGDIIVFRSGKYFDLVKDTMLVYAFDIIGKEK